MATIFRSPLALRLQAFGVSRQAAGQRGSATHTILRRLDQFLAVELKPGDTITQEVAQRWFQSMEHLSAGTRVNRVSVLRQFCLYLHYFDPRTCIIHRTFVPRRNRRPPYIYSGKQVRQIMAAATRIGPRGSVRPLVTSTLIGLLFSAGLRIGEALRLDVADLELKRRLLQVRCTKFNKSRYVPLSPSTADHLAAYLRQLRRAGFATSATSPLFVSILGNRYSASAFATAFLAIIRQLGIRGPRGHRGARIHDARHTFCVNRLLAWYRDGANLFAKLPALSTYVGHASVSATQVYLHKTAELLVTAGKRFHAHFGIPPPKGKKHASR
ncbi:MAG: tyrosine-type recombinase/integrase [Verrucomicrobia bacterium]|nr:tyrosine-type recombinase/integrase [Verrucomicrobiota bacterium]